MGYPRFAVSVVTTAAFVAMQIPTVAFAQNSAQAEVLFKEGQTLISQQKYAEACQRLVASYKLDPQPNTELLQGLCYSKQGKTASAYNAFIDAASTLPKGGDAQKYAADQAKTLEGQLLKVRVTFQPAPPPGMMMHFDDEGKPRDKDFVGIDIALDPGEHDLYVTAPSKHDYTKHFTLASGNSPHVVVVNMTDKTKDELAAEQRQNGGGQIIVEKPETSWSTVKTVGMVGIIVGGAVVLGAAVTQILAFVFDGDSKTLQSRSTSNGHPCGLKDPTPTGNADCDNAISYHSQALAAQSAAIGMGIAGGVVAVTGIILFIVGGNVTKTPEKAAASLHFVPWFGPQGAGMGLSGSF